MPKTKVSPKTDVATANDEVETMTNNVPTPTVVDAQTSHDAKVIELRKDFKFSWETNDAATSERIVAYFDNREWDSARDLSLFTWDNMRPALSAVAKFAAEQITGSPKLVITAPEDKAGYDNATGVFGYVRYDFIPGDDAIEITVNGAKVLLDVAPESIPTKGFRRLSLSPMGLYAAPSDGALTPSGEVDTFTGAIKTKPVLVKGEMVELPQTWQYWYVQTLSCLLDRANVCISANAPSIRTEAQTIWAVINSGDIEAIGVANDTRRYNNREMGRATKEAKTQAEVTRQENPGVAAPKKGILVSLEQGGDYNLETAEVNAIIQLADASGNALRPRRLLVGDVAERLSLQSMINKRGWVVRL